MGILPNLKGQSATNHWGLLISLLAFTTTIPSLAETTSSAPHHLPASEDTISDTTFSAIDKPLLSKSGKLAISANAGLLGLGAELSYQLHPRLTIRTGLQALTINRSFDKEGIEYDGEITLNSWQTIFDWHPFTGKFHISAGLIGNNS